MCSLLLPVGLWVGTGLEVAGLILLINGLIDTRKRLDPEYRGFWRTQRSNLGRWFSQHVVAPGRRLLGRPGKRHSATGEAAVTITSSVSARGQVSPNWDAETQELIRGVFEILAGRIEEARAASEAGLTGVKARIEDEGKARAEGDSDMRELLRQLGLGGLAKESWAVVLIITGLFVTFATNLCLV